MKIVKRDGHIVDYDKEKIRVAIGKANNEVSENEKVSEKEIERSIDICEHMGFSKPSVSRAVGKLKADGYILVDKSGFITLTESGRAIAERIYDRHNTLENIFMIIGVDQPTAEDDACKLEHYLSDTTYEALKKYFKI